MGLAQNGFGGNVLGSKTEAANTVIYAVVPGVRRKYTAVCSFQINNGNTANAGYWLRPLGRASTSAAANTSVAALALDADPSPDGNTIAAGDQVVVEHADGTYRRYQVNTSGWASNTNTVTFTGNLAANTSAGAKVFNMGVFTDTDPVLGTVHPKFPAGANTNTTYTFTAAGIRGHQKGDPLLFYSPNADNASTLQYAEYALALE